MQGSLRNSDVLALPKVVLHDHLDGGLRPETMLELCCARGIVIPVDTAQGVAQWLSSNANSGSLERYVAAFGPTVAAMASPLACERVAYEAVMDVAADGALLAEFRMAPLLLEPHGLAFEAAVEAMVEGLQRGTRDSGVPAGLIVCAMRHEPSERVRRAAELAARYAQHGVIGFDLAGAEKGFPATAHASAIAHAREAGLGITLHAGEADDGERVIEAIELGATRIGHGVRIAWGEGADERMAQAREAGVHFEVCLTSNLHTGACTRIEEHPLPRMLAAGLSASIQTDNRLMSLTTGSQEYVLALGLNLSREQIMQGAREAAGASFLPAAVRERVAARL